ncbi:MAG TPA: multicopper oxidase [Candidatus Acidoferrum sp.]|nr:multicopper oxidase [Candidatus Acidoferrum sp.]
MNRKAVGLNRREFLQDSGILLAGLAFAQGNPHRRGIIGRPLLNLDALTKFVDPLPVPRVAVPSGKRPHPQHPSQKIPYYRLTMREVENKIHRDVKPTRFWGYGNLSPGPTFETRSGEPLLVEWVNNLPTAHMLPVDHHIHGAGKEVPDVRTVSHLHGAKAPPESDGYPEAWFPVGKSATYFYPNEQDAAMLWYHDHALGITRLNIYTGLLGAYFVRDSFEDGLNLPKGKHEIPLILCDRFFDAEGQLYYPVSPDPAEPWIPELYGNATLINGKLYPYLDVEPCKYRFRLLNGSNARFFYLTLSTGQEFHQIGTDLGLLPAPVSLKRLEIAPAERFDLIVDFAGHAGATLTLNDGVLPVMQFRVSKASAPETGVLPSTIRPVPKIPESESVQTRLLTLGEKDSPEDNPEIMLLNNAHWGAPITENPRLGSAEIWSFANFTDDTHPIHLHLVRFQVLDRRTFQPVDYYTQGKIVYLAPAEAPAPNELGWKDTVQAHPQMVTRIITRFEGFTGRYVWHCHILEHEDNEMMRPFEVIAASADDR